MSAARAGATLRDRCLCQLNRPDPVVSADAKRTGPGRPSPSHRDRGARDPYTPAMVVESHRGNDAGGWASTRRPSRPRCCSSTQNRAGSSGRGRRRTPTAPRPTPPLGGALSRAPATACWNALVPSVSAPSSTGWWSSTTPGRCCDRRCSGTTSARRRRQSSSSTSSADRSVAPSSPGRCSRRRSRSRSCAGWPSTSRTSPPGSLRSSCRTTGSPAG